MSKFTTSNVIRVDVSDIVNTIEDETSLAVAVEVLYKIANDLSVTDLLSKSFITSELKFFKRLCGDIVKKMDEASFGQFDQLSSDVIVVGGGHMAYLKSVPKMNVKKYVFTEPK